MKKITDTQIFALLLVLAVGMFLLVYFLPFANLKADVDSYKTSNSSLRSEITELQVYHDNRAQYESDTEVLKKEVSNIVTAFPSEYKEEDYIMEAVKIENACDNKLYYESINMGEPSVLTSIDEATIKQAEIEDLAGPIDFVSVDVDYNNTTNYPGLKDALAEIFASPYKLNIKQITYTNDGTGVLDGVIKLGYYSISGNGREYSYPQIPEYQAGTTNIFIGGNLLVMTDEDLSQPAETTEEVTDGTTEVTEYTENAGQ